MSLLLLRRFAFPLLIVLIAPSLLMAADAEGCADSPLIARMPGSTLDKCTHRESGQAAMSVQKGKDVVDQIVEGDYQSWGYVTKNGTSDTDVFRFIQDALKQAGFQIDYESEPERITGHKGNVWFSLENRGDYYKQIMVSVKTK